MGKNATLKCYKKWLFFVQRKEYYILEKLIEITAFIRRGLKYLCLQQDFLKKET